MIVTITRNAADLAAIRQSGMRAIAAMTVDAGLRAAARPDIQLLVCDLRADSPPPELLSSCLRAESIPCPLIVRHDVSRRSIAALYELSGVNADIRSSFRSYDELAERLRTASQQNDANATPAILRSASAAVSGELREFIGLMAVVCERPVMQTTVAAALGMSRSSFRRWLAERRLDAPAMPTFPRLNAVFVALHLVWRRERLGWTAKRASAAAGLTDEKSAANYFRYHLGKTSGQVLRTGGFDALMTQTLKLFSASAGPAYEPIRRI